MPWTAIREEELPIAVLGAFHLYEINLSNSERRHDVELKELSVRG